MPHSVYIQARRHIIILSGVVTLSELWSGLITYKSKENIGPHLSVNSLLQQLLCVPILSNGSQVWNLHLQRDIVYNNLQTRHVIVLPRYSLSNKITVYICITVMLLPPSFNMTRNITFCCCTIRKGISELVQ